MKKAFWQLLLLITILCWALPSEAIDSDEVPPGTETHVSAYSKFYSNGMQPYEIDGLGARWKYASEDVICGLDDNLFIHVTTYAQLRADLRCDFKPNRIDPDIIAPYISLNASSTGIWNAATVWAIIDYTYTIKPKRPDAPQYESILLNFEAWVDLSLHINCTYDPSSYACGWHLLTKIYEYAPQDYNGKSPEGDWKAVKHLLEISPEKDTLGGSASLSDKAVFTQLALPNETRNVRLLAYGSFYASYTNDSPFFAGCGSKTDGFIVSIDPTITIDPDSTVKIDGVEYPANEVYMIDYSMDWFDLIPKAMPGIPLLLLDE